MCSGSFYTACFLQPSRLAPFPPPFHPVCLSFWVVLASCLWETERCSCHYLVDYKIYNRQKELGRGGGGGGCMIFIEKRGCTLIFPAVLLFDLKGKSNRQTSIIRAWMSKWIRAMCIHKHHLTPVLETSNTILNSLWKITHHIVSF